MDPVTQSLFGLADRVERYGSNRRADELALQNLGLNQAQFGAQQKAMEGQQAVELSKAKREQWLNEEVTIGQAIDTHPKWTPQQKEAVKMSIPEKERNNVLNHPITRGQLNSAMMKMQEDFSSKEQKRLDRETKKSEGSLNRKSAEKIAGMRSGSSTETLNGLKLQAWKDFIAGRATPEQQAMIGADKDPYMGKAVQIVSQDLSTISQPADVIAKKVLGVADEIRKQRQQNPNKPEMPPLPGSEDEWEIKVGY